MKKLSLLLSVLLLISICFSACTGEPTTSSSDAPSSSDTSSVVEVSVKPEEASFKKGDVLNGENKQILNLQYVTELKTMYEKIELKADLDGLDKSLNVFDEKDVDYSIALTSAKGTKLEIDGFYFEEFAFSEKEGEILDRTDSKPDFRLRFTLTESGTWDFTVTLKVKGEVKDSISGYINVTENKDNHGYLTVETKRRQNFMFTDGTGFAAVGENTAGSYDSASMRSAQMIEWMSRSAQYGSNFTRIWLSQWLLSIQKDGYAPNDFSAGMGDAAQLDKVVEAWEELGMYGQISLFTFNQLAVGKKIESENGFYCFPYNAKTKGGYINEPKEFFTNEKAIEDTKTYLRYLVARYGYSTNIFAWEFFNEVDGCTGYGDVREDVRQWHKIMAEYLRSIDSYDHMITTSTANREDVLNYDVTFDFMSLHWYDYGALSNISDLQKANWQLYKRPIMLGECGNYAASPHLDEDLVNFHQQNWTGLMGGGAGTAASWYWEKFDEIGGYWDFQVVSEMASHIPWNSDNMFMVATDNTNIDNEQVDVLGYRGDNFSYLWLYDNKYSHFNKSVTDFDGVKFRVKLTDGEYHVRWIDAWTGMSISQTVETAKGGYLELTTPKWAKDVAVAITVD